MTTIGTEAVRIFPPAQFRIGEVFCLPDTLGDEVFLIAADAASTSTNASIVRVNGIRRIPPHGTWRGHRILSEADLQSMCFPYPPEPGWDIP
jgi:hypothetical protein